MNEAQTEYELIDPALKQSGWGEVEGSKVLKQFPISKGRLIGQGRTKAPLKADYVLEFRNRKLAVVEAKSSDKYYTEGISQAKDYATRLNTPYCFATNGKQLYLVDMFNGKEGDIPKYPSPDELWEMCFAKEKEVQKEESAESIAYWKKRFNETPLTLYKGKYKPYYFQEVAINKVLDKIAEGKERLLLTMATGTGKTATAFHICWKLFNSKWNRNRDAKKIPRILFLADRNILADQAFNSFLAFEDDALVRIRPDGIKKKGKVPKNGSVFFTIFQTFQSGDKKPYFGEYPKDFFDFIIIDECHRGGAKDESKWRAIMEHFSPAVQLGLTATPKRDVNADTYKYFGEPIYQYSLKEGINDGFLTPFKVKEISTTIDDYIYTDDDDVLEGEVEQGDKFAEPDFNRIIEIKEREQYRVKILMNLLNPNEKTLVFCAIQDHAAAIRDLINQYSEIRNPDYCHRVTADDGNVGEQHLRDFQDNEKSIPTVLTTSRKLSTGVDAPEVRNIVLLRPVKSMVEFKQIIGRGTRLYEGKDYFTIYDFVKAHDHFKDDEWDGEPLEPEPPKPRPEGEICEVCGQKPCVCKIVGPLPCDVCGQHPCVCKRKMIRIKLSENKFREIDSMIKTSFWSPDGKPISSDEFIKKLFGDLPKFFKDEGELRKIWSIPSTRKKLLQTLEENGYSEKQLKELRKIVHGEESELYDVLNYIAYHKEMIPRLKRAEKAKIYLNDYNPKQQEFINFVLQQYVRQGISELDDNNLKYLLDLKYKALADAKSNLGEIENIRKTFIGFQEILYREDVG